MGEGGRYIKSVSDPAFIIRVHQGSSDGHVERTNMGRGKASTNILLVSRLFPRNVLNRKGSKNKRSFNRTQNWRTTWKKAIDKLYTAYTAKSDFYDNISRIENKSKYTQDKIKAIESINSWAPPSLISSSIMTLTNDGFFCLIKRRLIDILAKQACNSALSRAVCANHSCLRR